MANTTEYIIDSNTPAATEAFAQKLGLQLKGGEVIELIGDLGSGKTTFVRGLARGIESTDHVTSPTFTLRNVYEGRIDLYHYDLYRLHQDALVKEELAEVIADKDVTTVLEWADDAHSVLPEEHIVIRLKLTGETSRSISISIPENNKYLEIS